jgi:hypothetical protein
MAHLPGNGVHVWRQGEQLTAEQLNDSFAAVRAQAEGAFVQALTPNPAVVGLEMRLGRIEQRVAALERLAAMHERQRNEKEWAPLSHLGAVLQRVMNLQTSVEDAVERVEKAHAEVIRIHNDQHLRLLRIEQRPEAATIEEHTQLAEMHAETMMRSKMALGQAIGLRHEVDILRKLALGHDRNANRLEFAPLATVAHLLQRVMEIEKRLGGEAP